jgi:hypothetical protein
MLVGSHDMFRKVGCFDRETGVLQEAERSEVVLSGVAQCGHYSRAGGDLTVFYRVDDNFYLWLSGRQWSAEPLLVDWSKKGHESCLTVQDRAGIQAQIRYEVQPREPYDMTPFIEDEDWDFGLFVTNVLNSPGRRARIYG